MFWTLFVIAIVTGALFCKILQRVKENHNLEIFAQYRERVDDYSNFLHYLFEKEYPGLFTLKEIHMITDFILDFQKAYDALKEIADNLRKDQLQKEKKTSPVLQHDYETDDNSSDLDEDLQTKEEIESVVQQLRN